MRRRIIRLSTAVTMVAILLFGLPLAIGLTRYFIAEQHRSLHDADFAVAVAVSGDQGLRPGSPPAGGVPASDRRERHGQ